MLEKYMSQVILSVHHVLAGQMKRAFGFSSRDVTLVGFTSISGKEARASRVCEA
jgi:hypothetical protein